MLNTLVVVVVSSVMRSAWDGEGGGGGVAVVFHWHRV